MIPSELKYSVEQITTNSQYHFMAYDEVLDLIKNWGGGELHSNKHMLIKTNYPWVYKSSKEITGNLDDYKLLVLPSIQLFDRLTLAKIKTNILQDKYAHFFELMKLIKVLSFNKFHKLINENNEKKILKTQQRVMCRYNITKKHLQTIVDENVHFIRNICTIQMKGNTTLLTLLQGRKSMIRNAIPRKVTSLRTQILVHPGLKPDQVIYPVSWARMFGISPKYLVDLQKPGEIPENCFHPIDTQKVTCKRDPAIDQASVSVHTSISFAESENQYVSMAEMEHKNADCDGDTMSNTTINDILSVQELLLNMSTRNRMLIYNKPRISFTESLILYMHQREIDDNCFPYSKFYKFLRTREIRAWLKKEHNRQMLIKMDKQYPEYNLIKYVEPTREILQKMLTYLPLIESSKCAYDFYNFINTNVLRLANGAKSKQESPLYDPKLPCDYYMKDDILCESIIRICMSNAKGCLESLQIFADRLYNIDNTTKLTTKITPNNKNFTISQSDVMSQTMANKSRQVAINGHNFFKSNISYDTLNFDNNKFKNNNIILLENINFLNPCLLLPPDICFALTFIDELI